MKRQIPDYMKINNKPVWDMALADLDKSELQDMLHKAYLDLCHLQEQYDSLNDDLVKAQEEQNKRLEDCEDYQRMVEQLDNESKNNKALSDALTRANARRDKAIEESSELKEKVEKLTPKHNARGAGRKSILSEVEKESIIIEHAGGAKTDELAEKYGVSVWTIRRLIRDKKAEQLSQQLDEDAEILRKRDEVYKEYEKLIIRGEYEEAEKVLKKLDLPEYLPKEQN